MTATGRLDPTPRPVLITGGCGFVGINLAHRLLNLGQSVILYDNLSRPGVEKNLEWLREMHPHGLRFEQADVVDFARLSRAVREASFVYHLAAQVAVTTSLADPFHDFEVNARGTLNVLEAVRATSEPPPVLFTSTNKVYGALEDLPLDAEATRYAPPPRFGAGVSEDRPLSFHSPYGCSKGTADQYVTDYARCFGLQTVVFRMSCIYGPHQFGNEDQGWVAHFLIRALQGEPITIYGDGLQVRDVLFVEDLVDAFLLAREQIDSVAGSVFNIGGGVENTLSLVELLEHIRTMTGTEPQLRREEWRTGDQRYYVSDIRRFAAATGWSPGVHVEEGLARLVSWLKSSALARAGRTRSAEVVPLKRASRQEEVAAVGELGSR